MDYLAAVDSGSIQVLTVDLQKPVEIHGVRGVATLFLDGLGGAGDLSLSYQGGDVVLQFAVARHVFIEGVHEFGYIAVTERGRHGGENIDDVGVGVGEEARDGDRDARNPAYSAHGHANARCSQQCEDGTRECVRYGCATYDNWH